MKTIVVYSTRTGNTKKVAEAIAAALPPGTPCQPLADEPDLTAYDCVFLGFWVDRGTANQEAQDVIRTLKNDHICLFATLGANPKSEHAASSLKQAEALLPDGKAADGTFICQGAVDPKVIEMMYKKFPAGSPHGRSPERDALHAEAAKHPDAADLSQAAAFARDVYRRITEG